jgi:hypothetical protein
VNALLRFIGGTPIRLVLSAWLVTIVLFYGLPVRYTDGPRLSTLLFLLACLAGFVYGNAVVRLARANYPAPGRAAPRILSIEPPLRIFAALGIVGGVLVGIDKIVLGGLDLSQGLGVLRFALQSEEEMFKQRSIALWVGTALYSFSNIALVLYLLEGERVRRATAVLVLISSLSPAFVVLLYGGRSSAIMLIFSFVGACLVRLACGQRLVPKTSIVKLFFIVYCGVVLVGSLYIFTARAETLRGTWAPEVEALYAWMDRSGVEVSDELGAFLNTSDASAALVANLLLAGIYGTHGLSELDYLLNDNADAGPFWGLYQGWMINKALATAFGVPNVTETFASVIHHTGLFFTAWGAMLLDFGPWGAPLAFVLFGMLAGWLYVRGVFEGSIVARIGLTFVYMYILISPMDSALSMGNGFLMLTDLGVAAIALTRWSHAHNEPILSTTSSLRPVMGALVAGPGGSDH